MFIGTTQSGLLVIANAAPILATAAKGSPFLMANTWLLVSWGGLINALGRVGADLEVDDRYDLKAYLEAVLPCADDPARRCPVCYRIRLDEVARRAAAGGYDAFTTTLLVSPYQDHGAVARAGREAGEARGVPFYYRDFRPGWKQAVRISRELGMYRQGYCGCVFSERERYYRAARRGE